MARIKWHVKKYLPGLILLAACQVLAQEHSLALKDPTRPLEGGGNAANPHVEASTELVLQAIFHRTEGYEAIVNGQRVMVGDRVMDVRITHINANSVSYSGASMGTLILLPHVGNQTNLQGARQ